MALLFGHAVLVMTTSANCHLNVFIWIWMWCFVRVFSFFFQMHENKYLHLPVVDETNGNVLGVVSVMEIIQATAGEEGSAG